MSKDKNHQEMWLGALTAGVLGTVATLLRLSPTKNKQALQKREEILNKKMVVGCVAGGVIGATMALLFAPKSGADLMKGFSSSFFRNLKKTPPLSLTKKKHRTAKKKETITHKAHPLISKKTTRKPKKKIAQPHGHEAHTHGHEAHK